MPSIPARAYGLCILSALLQLIPFPFHGPASVVQRLFCWVCLVPFLRALTAEGGRYSAPTVWQGAALGYLCGFCWYLGNCYWIYQTMSHYGGLPAAAALGILVLFSLYLGLYLAAFAAAFCWFRTKLGPGAALTLSPFLWVGVELARARITGFPWDLLGYTQVDNSMLGWIGPVAGVMGLSLVVAAGNALWFWQAAGKLRFAGPLIAVGLAGLQVFGAKDGLAADPAPRRAVLLQENLSVGAEAEGPRESQPAMVRSFAALSAHPDLVPGSPAAHPDLIAWPEAPTSFVDADPNLRAALGAVARREGAPLVADAVGLGPRSGAPDAESGRVHADEFVSASFYLPDGTYAGRYDKMHLVPFGEYTPYKRLFFFAGHLLDGLNFVPGTERRLFSVNGRRFGVFICYESIFGDEIRHFAQNGAQVLVNLSDDGWYGDTSAPWEHLDMARMRAIENRRWLLRDTNTGLTASIDPEGRIVASLPRHVRDALAVPFDYRSKVTFYTRFGDWIATLCCVVVLGAGLYARFGAGAPIQRSRR